MKRIGNQVENIVELATNLDSTYAENYLSIGRMAESTIRMVKLSIQAFVNKDLDMAKEAKLYDDIIDELFLSHKKRPHQHNPPKPRFRRICHRRFDDSQIL